MRATTPIGSRVVWWWDGNGWRLGVECKAGNKFVHVVALIEGVGVVKRRIRLLDYVAKQCYLRGERYPIRRARAHYRRIGKRWGITQGAEDALKAA